MEFVELLTIAHVWMDGMELIVKLPFVIMNVSTMPPAADPTLVVA